jgi:hypothetical protein
MKPEEKRLPRKMATFGHQLMKFQSSKVRDGKREQDTKGKSAWNLAV